VVAGADTVLLCSTIETVTDAVAGAVVVAGTAVVAGADAVLRCSTIATVADAVAVVVAVGICTDSPILQNTTATATDSPTATATVCLLEHRRTAFATATAKPAITTATAKTAPTTAIALTTASEHRRLDGAKLKVTDPGGSNMSDDDPRRIQSLAVTAEDVVAAYEARQRSPRRPVLRVTPPFSGRMRARLHDLGSSATAETVETNHDAETDLDAETGALLVPPERFVAEDAISAYPSPDETEDALRENPAVEFSVERHRERHVEAVEKWREAVADAIGDSVTLRLDGETRHVEVKTLGEASKK
jgi:hypothetical protein